MRCFLALDVAASCPRCVPWSLLDGKPVLRQRDYLSCSACYSGDTQHPLVSGAFEVHRYSAPRVKFLWECNLLAAYLCQEARGSSRGVGLGGGRGRQGGESCGQTLSSHLCGLHGSTCLQRREPFSWLLCSGPRSGWRAGSRWQRVVH